MSQESLPIEEEEILVLALVVKDHIKELQCVQQIVFSFSLSINFRGYPFMFKNEFKVVRN
jgi:hypothetical protein